MPKIKSNKQIEMFSKARLVFVCFIVCIVLCSIVGRLYYLHVVRSDTSLVETEKQRKRVTKLMSKRGNITDANKNLLATSSPLIIVGVDPETFKYQLAKDNGIPIKKAVKMSLEQLREYSPSEDTTARLKKVAEILEVPYNDFYSKLISKGHWVKIKEIEDEATLKEILNCRVKAVCFNREYIRRYPSASLLSHIIGYVNKSFVPQMGVEKQFNFYLNGQDGWIETERDARRAEQPQFRTRKVEAVDGHNVELTIDIVLQEIVQRQMSKIVATFNPQNAAIIVSDPSTGYILAMANHPNFDPNKYYEYDAKVDKRFVNYSIYEQYEPGSTFKIVPVAAALNESIIGPDNIFDCTQTSMTYQGKPRRLPKDDHPLGKNATVRDIIKKSSNRGSALIGGKLGGKKLVDYAKAFGFGTRTEIGLTPESRGHIIPIKNWDGLTITRMPIGHSVSATPLQIHCAMAVIANQGVYMRPQLVKRVYNNKNETILNYSPLAERRVISPKVASLMAEMLSEVPTKTGTARRAAIKGFKVAGKTGTSQKLVPNPNKLDKKGRPKLEYSNKQHIASFTGFFPAKAPRLVITVVVDSPKLKGVGYGGLVAAPAFKEIGEQAAVYLGIQSDEEFEKKVAWRASINETF